MTQLKPSRAARFVASLGAVFAVFFGSSGCDDAIDIENSAPRVTFVAVEPQGDDVATITLWVSDIEGDSVDVTAVWLDSAGAATPIIQAEGSYGLVGLPTRDALQDPTGQPHAILWDTTDVPATDVQLRFVPDDRPFESKKGEGAEGTSTAFNKANGLTPPAELQ
jgi:hypothetical protein